jgi:hypothetical protein
MVLALMMIGKNTLDRLTGSRSKKYVEGFGGSGCSIWVGSRGVKARPTRSSTAPGGTVTVMPQPEGEMKLSVPPFVGSMMLLTLMMTGVVVVRLLAGLKAVTTAVYSPGSV